jgi:hypothetical protein
MRASIKPQPQNYIVRLDVNYKNKDVTDKLRNSFWV